MTIEDSLRENRLGCFEHVCRRSTDAILRSNDMIIGNDNTRGRSRPKLTLDVVVKNDIIELNLCEHLFFDRSQ